MITQPSHAIPSINDVVTFAPRGPWTTKSNGELDVLFAIPFELIEGRYFSYDKAELEKLPEDIRGFRSYRVSKLQKGAEGANEWHRIRNEIVVTSKGSVSWTVEDMHGQIAEFTLATGESIWIPPYIIHTYNPLSDDTELTVLASTLFIPDNPATHDTFSRDSFDALQKSYQHP